MSIGIPIEDWDDTIHIKSDRFIAFGDHDDHAGSPPCDTPQNSCPALPSNATLAERDMHIKRWNAGDCRSLTNCSKSFASSLNIGAGWTQAVNAAYKLKTYGQTFVDWTHAHPWSISLANSAGSTLSGYGLGYTHGGATAQDNTQFGQCANGSTQVQAFIQSFIQNGASSLNAAEINITLPDGNILTLSGEVVPAATDVQAVCDAEGQ